MVRAVLALAGLALLACVAWWFLRDGSERGSTAGLAPSHVGESDPQVNTGVLAPRTEAERESVGEPEIDQVESAAEDLAPLTGVLAGCLLLDGQPLRESAGLWLSPAPQLRGRAGSEGGFDTDALGRFRREGLPQEWSGRLVLLEPYRVAGADEERASFVDVEALSESLVIDVVRQPCLVGRLTHARPELSADVHVDLSLHEPTGARTWATVESDAAGRFRFVLADGEPERVEVKATALDGASFERSFARDALLHHAWSGDLDVGDVPLRGGFEAHVRVLDPERAPIAEARVFLDGDTMRTRGRTDASGEVRFPVSERVTGMRISARGFALVRLPPPVGTERVDVVLGRTNGLRIAVLDDQGQPWVGGSVKLRAEGGLFLSHDAMPPTHLVHGGRRYDRHGNVDARGRYELLQTADDGATEIQEVMPGVELSAQILDPIGRPWIEERIAGLGPDELREVALRLPPIGARLRGRCTDANGGAIVGASVWIDHESGGLRIGCTPDGSFESPPLAPGLVRISGSCTGYATAGPLEVDSGDSDVRLELEPGRAVRVELRDALGQEIHVGELKVRRPGTERIWSGTTSRDDALYTFRDLPMEPMEVVFEWFGRSAIARIGADQERASLVVDALGSVEVDISSAIVESEEWAQLHLRALDGPVAGTGIVESPPTAGRPRTIQLWPGRYELQLFAARHDALRKPLAPEPYLDPVRIEVRAGETSRLTLGTVGSSR
jgi:hypothetical protein